MTIKSTLVPTKTISILGCGWYGLALAKSLVADGISVKGSSTSVQKLQILAEAGVEPYLVNFSSDQAEYDTAFFNCDILFIAISPKSRLGEGVAYFYKIQRIISAIKQSGTENVVFISSTGVYADVNSEVNERTEPQPNSASGQVLFAAEKLFRADDTFKTTIIRFAGLIGPGRDGGTFFAGKKNIPNGNAPVNLIHLDDCIGISKAIITSQAFGYLFNGCSPSHPLKSVFYTQAAIHAGIEPPEFIDELNEWKIVKSIYTAAILNYKYEVQFST